MLINKRINYFFITEIRKLKKTPLPFLVAFVLPAIVWIFLAFALQNGAITNISISVVDYDNSQLSRKIIRDLEASEALKVGLVTKDKAQADEMMSEQKSFFTVIINKDFSRKIRKNQAAEVSVIANSFALINAKVGYRSIATVLLSNSANILVERLVDIGISKEEAIIRAAPITTDIQAIGNPYFNYTVYMLPGILISFLQMSGSFSALWLFRENREHYAGRVMPPRAIKVPWLIGRLIPIFLMNLAAVVFLYSIVFPLSNIPINNMYFSIFSLSILLIIVSIGMGALVSVMSSNIITGAQILLGINAPAFVFAGYTFPRWAMPDALRYFGELLPITNFLDAFFPMYLYGESPHNGVIELLISALIVWGMVALMISKIGANIRNYLRKKLAKYKEKEQYSISK